MSPVGHHLARLARLTVAGPVALVVAALVAGSAGPARAGSTAVSITVLPGPLTISAPTLVGLLTTDRSSVHQAALGQLMIHDGRAIDPGGTWVASITWSAFRSAAAPTVDADAVTYLPGPLTRVGTAVYTGRTLQPAGPAGPAGATVTATGVLADNLAVWDPTLLFTTPSGADAADYSATITYSVC